MHDDDNDPREDAVSLQLCKAAKHFDDAAGALGESEWNTNDRPALLCKAHAAISLGWRLLTQAEIDCFGPVPLDDGEGGAI